MSGVYIPNMERRTNGDRLREMSDDELSRFLNGVESDGRVYGPVGKQVWLKWLKEVQK